ncbi:dTDP-4-dehydrorhamnose 3,5-epimerase [Adhaeribacter aerolatus]|uniref:dTDP-4-dehydrorhamnose 3,5-epimerase n=1 Tax=Adhaeribacter aerolatus TaxID=670289 RepID=A0A512AXU1_9BACT|nr:NAD-dependent epimerase/dehydratase family protein [Adhaeribacter aerolatus]GEO04533.1 dTDP-4-dehydrorhamnose 3,5-epimerase [Adhaeribacter aerolatus]
MKIVITGANGFVGAALCRYFYQQGHSILAVGRQAKSHPNLAAIAEYLSADITQSLPPFRADVCIHAAALASDTATYQDLHENNVTGTRQVLAAARFCEYFVQISSSSVYQFKNIPAKESSATLAANRSPYGKTKLLADNLVGEDIPAGQKRIILRPRAIYGIGDRVLLPRLLELIKRNIVFCPVSAQISTSLTHVDNIAYAINLFLRQASQPALQIYNVADAPVYNLRQCVLQLLSAVYQQELKVCSIPVSLLKLLTDLNKIVPFSAKLNPLVLNTLTQSAVLDISAIRENLGYQPRYYFENRYPQIAAWLHGVGGLNYYLNNLAQMPWELDEKFAVRTT